ncbi:hypothetical protein GOBAR_AA25612 [Gossypium barbadense]|uniref:Uncharacterized protein n=1 Tax=Gossypium barbadense TaxID=3634 RepID=A0A2P5WVD9_GOSBA|nr:hypothetical protein GOBAR_AA25612 [Gossypium barbadense]
MADGEGNKVGKVKDVPIHHASQEVGVVSVDDSGALSPSYQSVGQNGGVSSSLSSMNSSVYSPSAIPNSGMLNWRSRPPRQNWTIPGSLKFVMTT